MKTLTQHKYYVVSIILIAFSTFSYYQGYWPNDEENLRILSLASNTHFLEIFTKIAFWEIPQYQPLSTLTLWIQYQIFGIAPQPYILINIFLWVLNSIMLYYFVYRFTKSGQISVLIALLFLLDYRSSDALLFIGRRNSLLALAAGQCALIVVLSAFKTYSIQRMEYVGLFFLLGLALFSDAKSAVFIGAILIYSVLKTTNKQHTKGLLITGLFILIIYLGIRFGLLETNNNFCYLHVGYRHQTLEVCYKDYQLLDRAKMFAWNSSAALMSTFFPQLFSQYGQWQGYQFSSGFFMSIGELVFQFLSFLAIGLAVFKKPKYSLPLLSIIMLNALLSLRGYQIGDMLIGIFAYYSLLGMGITSFQEMTRLNQKRSQSLSTIAILAFVIVLGFKSSNLSHSLETTTYSTSHIDPCMSLRHADFPEAIDPNIVYRLKVYYGDKTPNCPVNE
jgi:hypothetical protein